MSAGRVPRRLALILAPLLTVGVGAPARSAPAGQHWVTRAPLVSYDYGAKSSIAPSPDGSRLFTAGSRSRTAAYDSLTGAQLWISSATGVAAIVASTDGTLAFTTGATSPNNGNILTVAHDAADGTVRWSAEYDYVNLPCGCIERYYPAYTDRGVAIGRSADGRLVYVTGASQRRVPDYPYPVYTDLVTIAYDASTGAQRWIARREQPEIVSPSALAVASDGTVYVSGNTLQSGSGTHPVVVAYDGTSGFQKWLRVDPGVTAFTDGVWVAPSPDGARVYVASSLQPVFAGPASSITTQALSASTGALLWASSNQGPASLHDYPNAIAASSDGRSVYVTGRRIVGVSGVSLGDYVTIADDADTGVERWVATRDGGAGKDDAAQAISVSPDGSRIYVTGAVWPSSGYDFGTVAYDTSTGAERCFSAYGGPNNLFYGDADLADAVIAAADRVYVSGFSSGPRGVPEIATIGYARPQAIADAYAVTLAVDGVPQPVRVGPLIDSRASGNETGSAAVQTITLPQGLGDITIAQTEASAASEFACGISHSSAKILTAHLLGGLVDLTGLEVSVDSALSESSGVWSDSGFAVRRIGRLIVAGRAVEGLRDPVTVPLPGGFGTVALLETISRKQPVGSQTPLSEVEVRGVHIQTQLDTGQHVDLILGSAYAGTSDGRFPLTPRPAL